MKKTNNIVIFIICGIITVLFLAIGFSIKTHKNLTNIYSSSKITKMELCLENNGNDHYSYDDKYDDNYENSVELTVDGEKFDDILNLLKSYHGKIENSESTYYYNKNHLKLYYEDGKVVSFDGEKLVLYNDYNNNNSDNVKKIKYIDLEGNFWDDLQPYFKQFNFSDYRFDY